MELYMGAWVGGSRLNVQLLISGHDLGILGSSPALVSTLSGESIGDSLSPSATPHPPLTRSHALSLPKQNNKNKAKKTKWNPTKPTLMISLELLLITVLKNQKPRIHDEPEGMLGQWA